VSITQNIRINKTRISAICFREKFFRNDQREEEGGGTPAATKAGGSLKAGGKKLVGWLIPLPCWTPPQRDWDVLGLRKGSTPESLGLRKYVGWGL